MGDKPPSKGLLDEYLALKSFVFAFPDLGKDELQSRTFQVFAALESYEIPLLKRDLAGIKMAIGDCISASRHWSSDAVIAADSARRQRGILTLSELRRRYSKSLLKILARGQIGNDVEYYWVDGVLADESCEVSVDQRASLARIAESYRRHPVQSGAGFGGSTPAER